MSLWTCLGSTPSSRVKVWGPECGIGPPLVIITHLEDASLSLDVRARLAGRQLCRIDRWEIVRDGFRARQLDPRLPSQGRHLAHVI